MAIPLHLELLSEGVEVWNQRRQDTLFNPDLQRANLSGADLQSVNFRNADLRDANLRTSNLKQAILAQANLREANLDEAKLQQADLMAADLSGAISPGTNFEEAHLRMAILQRTLLRGSILRGANMHFVDMKGADLRSISDEASNTNGEAIRYTDFRGAKFLTQTQLDSAIGDNGVLLPDGLTHPDHWDKIDLPRDHPNYEPPEDTAEETPTEPEKEDPSRSEESARGPLPSPVRITPAAEFEETDAQIDLKYSSKSATPRTPSPTQPKDSTCTKMRETLTTLSEGLADMLRSYRREDKDISNRVQSAEQMLIHVRAMSTNLRAKRFNSFTFHSHIEILGAACKEAIFAFEEADQATIRQLLDLGRKHYVCYPELAEILDPANNDLIPDDPAAFPYSLDQMTAELTDIAFSEDGMLLFKQNVRDMLEAETTSPAPLGFDHRKTKLVNLGAIAGEMWRVMQPLRDKVTTGAAKMKDGVDKTAAWLKTYEKVEKIWEAVKPFLGRDIGG